MKETCDTCIDNGKCRSVGVGCWRPKETVIGDICNPTIRLHDPCVCKGEDKYMFYKCKQCGKVTSPF